MRARCSLDRAMAHPLQRDGGTHARPGRAADVRASPCAHPSVLAPRPEARAREHAANIRTPYPTIRGERKRECFAKNALSCRLVWDAPWRATAQPLGAVWRLATEFRDYGVIFPVREERMSLHDCGSDRSSRLPDGSAARSRSPPRGPWAHGSCELPGGREGMVVGVSGMESGAEERPRRDRARRGSRGHAAVMTRSRLALGTRTRLAPFSADGGRLHAPDRSLLGLAPSSPPGPVRPVAERTLRERK